MKTDLDSLYQPLYSAMQDTPLETWRKTLPEQLKELTRDVHGDYPRWQQALEELPQVNFSRVDFNSDKVSVQTQNAIDRQALEQTLKQLSPWRKGPYQINDVHIDTEWRSDWKWKRIKDFISPLKNRTVLDVGCGNGYHCWRMYGEGARLVLGIDPSWLFWMQFQAIKHFAGAQHPVFLLPMGIESLPSDLNAFDSVFSMGVLYHRRSPIDHLLQLKSALRIQGELILETLIIEGGDGESLMPDNRYAKMRNVWFLPSIPTLTQWLKRCGFINIQVVDINQTTVQEQRSTPWMPYDSLTTFLDPNEVNKTIEGYPAPLRATVIAQKP